MQIYNNFHPELIQNALETFVHNAACIDLMHWRHKGSHLHNNNARLVSRSAHVLCWQCALALSLSVRGPRRASPAVWHAGVAPLAACLAMTHVAVPRFDPQRRWAPFCDVIYAYGLLFISICCYHLEKINLIVLFISIVFHFHTVSENNAIILYMCLLYSAYCQLRTRRALMQLKDVPLRTRRSLLPLTLYSNSALLALNWRYRGCQSYMHYIKSFFFLFELCLEILILLLFINLQLKPHNLLFHNIFVQCLKSKNARIFHTCTVH